MDLEWLGDRQKPAVGAILRALAGVARPLRREGVVDVGLESSDLVAKSVENLLGLLADFGAVKLGGGRGRRTVVLTVLGRRWLESPAGQEVLERCGTVVAPAGEMGQDDPE